MSQFSWAPLVLTAAAIHCLLWGALIIVAPEASFRVYGFVGELRPALLWQGSGFTICLYGVGYAIAATDPVRHYGLVLVGLLAKTFGAIGIIWGCLMGVLAPQALVWVLVNDVVWYLPLGLIVHRACKSGIEG